MSYNEKCSKCKTTGHEYLIGDICMSCADKLINELEKENKELIDENKQLQKKIDNLNYLKNLHKK